MLEAVLLALVFALALAAVLMPVARVGPIAGVVQAQEFRSGGVTVRRAVAFDVSSPLRSLDIAPHTLGSQAEDAFSGLGQQGTPARITPPAITAPAGAAAVEQKAPGTKPAATLVASFDGLGVGFDGPQGAPAVRNPSDNSLAVGPNHIIQTVNTRMAIFTKKGKRFDTTGKALYGSVNTNNVFKGFSGM